MKKYELCFIVSENNTEDKAKDIAKDVEKTTVEQGAKIVKNFFWGKRKFAYPIQKENFGYYFILVFESDSEVIKKITKDLNLSGKVIRYLITKFLEGTSFWEEEKEGGGKRKEFIAAREKKLERPKKVAKEERIEKEQIQEQEQKEIKEEEKAIEAEEELKEEKEEAEPKRENTKEISEEERKKELEEKLAELLKEE